MVVQNGYSGECVYFVRLANDRVSTILAYTVIFV